MSDFAVEVVPARPGSGDLSSRPPSPEQLHGRIDELTDALAEVAARMHERLDKMTVDAADAWILDQVELQFGVALKAASGVLVVSALGPCDDDAEFEFALEFILDGLARLQRS